MYENARPNPADRFKSMSNQANSANRKNDQTHKNISTKVRNGRKQNGITIHNNEPLKS